MTKRRRIKFVGGSLLTLLAIGLLMRSILGLSRHPIEGMWQNHFYTDCMCDSYNFLLFLDGKIDSYPDKHLTDYSAGTYEDLGSGRYKVTINVLARLCSNG